MSDLVAEAISDINLAWRNTRPGAETISEQQCRHIARELTMAGLVPREVTTVVELDALPAGALIWCWLYYDGPIHSLMCKAVDGTWMNATDPDDAYEYTPLLPATVLSTGVQA